MATPDQLGKGPTSAIGGPGGGSRRGPLGSQTNSWLAWAQEAEHVPELRWPENVKAYERMLFTDSQVQSLYLGLTLDILNDVYWLGLPDAVAQSEELTAYAQALADDLGVPLGEPPPEYDDEPPAGAGLYRFNLLEHFSEALLFLAYGHYYFEQEGVVADGLWRLRKLGPRAPQTIEEFDVAEDGGLRWIRQNGAVVGSSGPAGLSLGRMPPIPIDRLVAYIWQPDARARWTGRSMLRALYRHWLVKDRLIRVDAINHDRAGGVPWAETDERWTGSSLEDLAWIASQFRVGEEAGQATPPGVKMHLLRAGGTDVIASMRYHDEAMARLWSGMVRQLGSTQTGSRALGEVDAGLEDLARRAVQRMLLTTFREHVIEDWWGYNVPPIDGHPAPHPVLACRKRGSAAAPSPPSGGPEEGGGPPPVAARSRPRRARAGAAERSRPVAAVTLPPRPLRRQPSDAEVRAAVDFAAMDLVYEQGAVDAEAWLVDVLREQVAAVSDAIVLTKKGEVRKVVTRAAMARIEAPVLGAAELAEVLLPAARAGAAGAVQEALAQGVTVVVPSDEALMAAVADHATAVAEQHAHGLSLSAQRKAVQMVQGRTPAEVAGEVVGYLGDLKHQWTRDQLHGAVQMALNTGRFMVMDQVPEEQPVAWEASELLDAATCAPCAADDGLQFATLAEAMKHYPSGGNHRCEGGPRCRGTVVAVYDEL